MDREPFAYDVCLSFAGEQRATASELAAALTAKGIRVFYDEYEVASLWGKDLYEHLDYVYRETARFCILFASRDYAAKVWTNHERRSAQARAIEENREYILPVRVDGTEIPGLRGTVGYVSLDDYGPEALAALIEKKLGPRQRAEFLPPVLDRLYEAVGVEDGDEGGRDHVDVHAESFFQSLVRMTDEERQIVSMIFRQGCPAELPENMHMSLDLLRRNLGRPASQIVEVLSGVGSLGFSFSVRESSEEDEHQGDEHDLADGGPLAVLAWANLTVGADELLEGEAMIVAERMLSLVGDGYCDECVARSLHILDFGSLSNATDDEEHAEIASEAG